MTAAQHPRPLSEQSAAAPAHDGAPAQQHGDPLLAASEGATEGTEGSRHGLPPATGPAQPDGPTQ